MNEFFPARKLICVALLVCSATISFAQPTNSPLQQIAPGIFQLGSVRLDKEKRTVRFPAKVNMTNGVVEYFVVTGIGKLHESILKTETEPAQIHMAMLLLGASVATNVSGTNITGDKFTMKVSWKNGDVEKRAKAEDLVFNTKTKTTMSKEGWIYNGSKVIDGTFIAQRDGSIVSIITDALALANSLQPDRDNDDIWFVNTNMVPSLNTSVEVTFQLQQKNTRDTK